MVLYCEIRFAGLRPRNRRLHVVLPRSFLFALSARRGLRSGHVFCSSLGGR